MDGSLVMNDLGKRDILRECGSCLKSSFLLVAETGSLEIVVRVDCI